MERRPSTKKKTPFSFVLEELTPLSPILKPMFGGFVVYIGEKMTLFLYDQEKYLEFKGVSLATTPEHYRGLAQEFSSTSNVERQKIGKRPWLLIPASTVDFEEQALKACEMILNGDPRIGRIPEGKKLKPAKRGRGSKRKTS
ncbi:MAG: hypothetical protein ACREEM_15410 [Blastocatellia bacterium]